ncbi:MAG: site-specific integrase, partial [Pseudomonadota bacterium]|nr:site-specific integrase [Pseudomonadota bacterium]
MAKAIKTEITKKDFENWLLNDSKSELSLGGIAGFNAKRNKHGATFRIRYYDGAGKRRFYKIGSYPAVTLQQARLEARKRSGEKELGADIQAERTERKRQATNTLGVYLDDIYSVTALQKAYGRYEINAIKKHFSEYLDRPLNSFSARDVTQWQAKMVKSRLSVSTIKKQYTALKTVLNHSIKRGFMEANPLQQVKLDPMRDSIEHIEARKEKRTYLSKEQINALFQGLNLYENERRKERSNSIKHGKKHLQPFEGLTYTSHVVPMIELMFHTGLRTGDIITLKWTDVNMDFGTLSKILNKTRHKNPDPTTLPLSTEALNTLKKWNIQNRHARSGYVFINPQTGTCFDKDCLRKQWVRIKDLSGLPTELDMYTLRHNFASWLVMNGVNLMTVAKLMGHSDVSMVIRHYAHLSP